MKALRAFQTLVGFVGACLGLVHYWHADYARAAATFGMAACSFLMRENPGAPHD